jgi:predicted NAD-dependent protein-ADP-ribosyltransferase YbiA (DUF1768 family)
MKILWQDERLVLVPESAADAETIAAWRETHAGHVLLVDGNDDHRGLELADLGEQEVACREPINVISTHPDEGVRMISNFAAAPFVLDGRNYRSVEGFWQGLKYEDEAERRRVAGLDGRAAKRAGQDRGWVEIITYEGNSIRAGSPEHWELMKRACVAKFTQCEVARAALLATAPRPFEHRTRRDSKEIPGVIMADIWMKIRQKLLDGSLQPNGS